MSHEGMIIDFQHDDVHQPRPWPVGIKSDNAVTSGLGSDDGATLVGFARHGQQELVWTVDEARDIDFTAEKIVPVFANQTGLFNWDIPIRDIRFIETATVPAPEVITDPHFIVDIRMGNIAMQDGLDIATALRDLADRLAPDGYGSAPDIDESGKILDANGQQVGTWIYKEIAR